MYSGTSHRRLFCFRISACTSDSRIVYFHFISVPLTGDYPSILFRHLWQQIIFLMNSGTSYSGLFSFCISVCTSDSKILFFHSISVPLTADYPSILYRHLWQHIIFPMYNGTSNKRLFSLGISVPLTADYFFHFISVPLTTEFLPILSWYLCQQIFSRIYLDPSSNKVFLM